MKHTVLSIVILCAGQQLATAQTVNDTVNTTPTYANNVWYSLDNDDQGSEAANAWHIGLSTDLSAMGELTTSMLFNHKIGSVYEIPGSDPANFSAADTAGMSTWSPLVNSEESWAAGAFNNTTISGQLDYGWGNYNPQTHGIDANRIFVIKLNGGGYRKLMISSANVAGTYTLVHDNLDNTDLTTETITAATYATKNFVYYNTTTKAIVDREPAKESWDLYFGQYLTADVPSPNNFVTGIFQNVGVEVAQVYPVNDVATFNDFSSATFSEQMNVIGWDWKVFTGSYSIVDSTVYFIDDVEGNIWKVIMTGFTGSSQGKYMFSKEKLTSVGIGEQAEAVFTSIYPNPAADVATIVLKNAPAATISVYSLTGTLVYTETVDATAFTTVQLNTSSLANGTYQVVCTTGGSVSMHKLAVQH